MRFPAYNFAGNYLGRNTVGNAVRRFEETGSNKNRIGQGRPRSARDEENVAAAAIAITAEPSTKFNSTRKLGKKMAISRDSAHRILVEDLGLKPYKMLSRQELGLAHIIKRLQRCRGMRRRFANGRHRNVVFTDEKIFTIEQAHNKQNDRVWMKELPAIEERLVTHEQHPQQVMVFAAICFNGKMPLVFADPDFSYNQAYYRQRILRHAVKPWAEEFFGEEQWTFQQDGAPMHTATLTQDWLRRNFPNFIDKNEWPPRSPDLNPLDFSIWSILEDRVCIKPHSNLESLKRALLVEWDKIEIDTVNKIRGVLKNSQALHYRPVDHRYTQCDCVTLVTYCSKSTNYSKHSR
uniref:Transposase n=1 Tax=Ditylenchus dipsaci TaxID=166011 RepID=A0A915DAQ7_9BILA